MSINVLFVYPNSYGMNMLPPAIALLSAVLKKEGHRVDLFDTTYYSTDFGSDSDGTKVDRLNVIPFNSGGFIPKIHETDWRDDLKAKVESCKPDLVAMSCTEDMWELGLAIIEEMEQYVTLNKTTVLVGGVFPTFAPEIAIQHPLVDAVCVGEGENAMRTLCERIEKEEPFHDVTNLWVMDDDGAITKNPMSDPVDVNAMPMMDVGVFEDQRLYRPMTGKWYKMLPVETIRGCPYKCAYCNSPNQMQIYDEQIDADYFRKRRMDLVYQELKHFKEHVGVEYNYFWADTFLALSDKEFDEFCEMYSDIKLPFWIQTRPETLTDYRVQRLAEVGLHRFSVGIEHGNEAFRTKILRRSWKNEAIIESLKIPHRYGVQFTCNNIVGFPTETRELAMETIELNRHIESDSQNMNAFVPFHGTPLRKMVEEMGFVKPGEITKCLTDSPMLDMPQFSAKEIAGLIKCFVLYVKFPKSRWEDIRRAEEDTPEGRKIFKEFKEEFTEKYMPKKSEANPGEVPAVADLEYGMELP
ncbi:MAG: radical SAM protein [Planctomycetes bacterium]|nr:radical SAM protein [Planctomycetota bacterium]